jgi:hypothetical protein
MQQLRALIVSGAVLGVAVAACTSKDSLLDGAGSSGKGGMGGASGGAGKGSGGSTGATGGSAGLASTGGAVGNGGSTGGSAGSVSTGGTGGATTGGSGGATDAGKGGTGGGSGEAGSGGTAGSGGAAGSAGAEQCPEGQIWCPGCTPGTGSCGVGCPGAQCRTCAEATTLEECEARPDCHSVFHDPGTCTCGGLGCCAEFLRCADGDLASCEEVNVSCDSVTPYCENPVYVVSYTNTCYEGCVAPKDCAPTCAATNDPSGCLCYSDADCAADKNCYLADCANQIPGVCTTPPPSGCFGDVDCPEGQTCIGGQPTGCSSTAPSIVGTCGVEKCAGGDCPGRSGPGCTCSDGEQCIEATGPLGSGACRTQDGTCAECMCAAPHTPIATPNGDRAIAELRPGDLVYSVDGEAIRAVPIVRINRTPVVNHSVLRVTFDNGRSIDMTAGHPLADGRPLSALRPGSELMGGTVVGVMSIPYEHDATYDILPQSTSGAYFASNVLVGSTLASGSIGRRATPNQLSTK